MPRHSEKRTLPYTPEQVFDLVADGTGATEVDFCVDFAFRNRLFEAIAGQMFDRALRRMIGAFEERARALYGNADSGSSKSSAHSAA
jgi:coenzyme Q-binding protein COQ10